MKLSLVRGDKAEATEHNMHISETHRQQIPGRKGNRPMGVGQGLSQNLKHTAQLERAGSEGKSLP